MDEHVITQVQALRANGLTPKSIARSLGISVSEATAALNSTAPVDDPDEPRCWINTGWSHRLDLSDAPRWAALDRPTDQDDEAGGLAAILIARDVMYSNKALVAGFLLDVWCLGVKNALPPEPMGPARLTEHRHAYFSAHQSHHQIPAALARDLVFGAEAYARNLGFEPEEDFQEAATVLGEPANPSPIRFGRDGEPFYVNGPYDDASAILATLRRMAGDGNFHYAIIGAPDRPRRRLSRAWR